MQAPDDDSAVSVVGGAGSPGSQGSLMDPEGCSSTGAAEAVAEGAPPVEMAAPPGEMAAPPVEVAPPPVEGAAPPVEGAAPQIEGAAPPVEGALLASGQAEEASAPGRAPVNQLLELYPFQGTRHGTGVTGWAGVGGHRRRTGWFQELVWWWTSRGTEWG